MFCIHSRFTMHLLKSSGSEFINRFVLISRITTEATLINRKRGHHTESNRHFWNKMADRWRMIYNSPDRSHVFSHLMTSVEFSFFCSGTWSWKQKLNLSDAKSLILLVKYVQTCMYRPRVFFSLKNSGTKLTNCLG